MTDRRRERDCATAHKRRIERAKVAAIKRRLVVWVKQEQFVADELPAVCPRSQWTFLSVAVQCPGDRVAVDVNDGVPNADVLSSERRDLLQDRHGTRQVATRR